MTVVGTRIGHFQITDVLGKGGMGEVYVAFDETLERKVALKAIRAEHRLDASSKARFLREARILSSLEHPNICRIYDYIEKDDSDFLVLELIDGRNLRHVAEALSRSQKIHIAEQIVQVLTAAHEAGVVHRDLKPENVMLTPEGLVKVLDFGLALSTEAVPRERPNAAAETGSHAPLAQEDSALPVTVAGATRFGTTQGQIMGTLGYMSPEQARGEPATSDSYMYSLGLVLQHLFTGGRPYKDGLDVVTLLQNARDGITLPVLGLDADLTGLIDRLKSLAPTARPTAVEVGERLRFIKEKPKRITRRLIAAAALVAVVLAGTKYTVDLRRERAIADQRRHQAEDLVEFMLGDLRLKLEPIGKLDILDDVGDKALDYFAAVPEERLSDDELLSRSMALYQIGEVRLLQDDADLSAALAAFEESLALSLALVAAQPDSVDRRFRLSQSEFWVGYVHWQRERLDDALVHFRTYLEIAEWLVETEPDNPDWRLELSYAHSNIGSVLEARGKPDAALEKYQETLAINRSLVQLEPANLEWKEQLAEQHNLVGAVQLQLGDLSGSLESFQADLELKRELIAADPENFGWLSGLANSHNWIAQVLVARGQTEEAQRHFTEDLELTTRLVGQDASNTWHQRALGRTRHALARLYTAQGRHDEAVTEARSSLQILSRLVEQDPSNPRRRLDQAASETSLARALLARGDRTAGEQALRAAAARLDLPPDSAAGPSELIVVSEILSLLAELDAPRNALGPFLEAWGSTLAALEPAVAASRDVRLLDPWMRVLQFIDRTEEAVRIRALLDEIGYRNPDYLEFMRKQGLQQGVS